MASIRKKHTRQETPAALAKSRWTVCFSDGQSEVFEAHRMSNSDGFTTFTNYMGNHSVEFVSCVNNACVKFIGREAV